MRSVVLAIAFDEASLSDKKESLVEEGQGGRVWGRERGGEGRRSGGTRPTRVVLRLFVSATRRTNAWKKKGNTSEIRVWHRISVARSPTHPTLSKTCTGVHNVSG